MSLLDHERRFKRKSRTSALPPIPDVAGVAAIARLTGFHLERCGQHCRTS
jgi:hypothetical protein